MKSREEEVIHEDNDDASDEGEEFGIDWTERDGFSFNRIPDIKSFFGVGADHQISPRGFYLPAEKLILIGKLCVAGLSNYAISNDVGVWRGTVSKMRRAIKEFANVSTAYKAQPLPSLVGRTFGKLTVRSYRGSVNKQRLWNCICECGRTTIVTSYRLTSGHTRSCRCISRQQIALLGKAHGDPRKRTAEYKREYFKTYRAKNIDRIKAREREYYEKNKERIKSKSRHTYAERLAVHCRPY